MKKKRKFALVMSGGGMRCVYGVGVLAALVEAYKLTEPDIIVASSGSVANAAYYLSGQYTQVIAAWLDVLADNKKFISFRRREILNVDYLVDEGFKKKNPFDFKELKRKRTEFFLATTRVKDGKTVYMKLPKNNAIYGRLRATKAVPIVYGKTVRIGINDYFDGDFGTNTDDLVNKALELGAQDVLVVENDPGIETKFSTKIMREGMYAEAVLTRNAGKKSALLREFKKPMIVSKKGARIVQLEPIKPAVRSVLEQKKRWLRNGFIVGYNDAVNSTELKEMLATRV